MDYKQKHSFEQRTAELKNIRTKYPERIPVIVEKMKKSSVKDIDKNKFLVPADITIGQFMYIIRKRIKIGAEVSIFLFIGDILPAVSEMMASLYDKNKDEDGFLYIKYASENTFGCL